jgi:adenylate kinase family enzyme
MRKIIIFGNSGSGKSTLAKALSRSDDSGSTIAHLDLDTLAWKPSVPPERQAVEESAREINRFVASNTSWVIEGCYSDLLEIVIPSSTEIIFMNLPVELCIQNARQRPWEPHKYESKEAQDANLEMLVDWISHYETRDDTFSLAAHRNLYDCYGNKKTEYISNHRNSSD